MNKKVLIVIISVFIMLLIPTTSNLAVPLNDNIENDNYFEEKSSKSSEYSYCLVKISLENSSWVSTNKTFVFRGDITFSFFMCSYRIFEIFKGKVTRDIYIWGNGELKDFTGLIFHGRDVPLIRGYARSVKIDH